EVHWGIYSSVARIGVDADDLDIDTVLVVRTEKCRRPGAEPADLRMAPKPTLHALDRLVEANSFWRPHSTLHVCFKCVRQCRCRRTVHILALAIEQSATAPRLTSSLHMDR